MSPLFLKSLTYFLRIFIWMIAYSPWKLLHAFAVAVGCFRSFFPGKERDWMNQNLHHIFNLPHHSNFAALFRRQVFYHQTIAVLESIRIAFRPSLARWEGLEDLMRCFAVDETKGNEEALTKGNIIITAHLGCWELVGYQSSLRSHPFPFYALAKPSSSVLLNNLMDRIRARLGIKVLWTGQKDLGRQMMRALHSGGALGFVMDQKPAGRVGPVVDFFGYKTAFVGGPSKMSARMGAAVWGVYCLRTGPMSYRLVCSRIAPLDHGIKDAEVLTQMMASDIEKMIRMYPEQWCWNYKRWKFSDYHTH